MRDLKIDQQTRLPMPCWVPVCSVSFAFQPAFEIGIFLPTLSTSNHTIQAEIPNARFLDLASQIG